jgi:hypothetical protein
LAVWPGGPGGGAVVTFLLTVQPVGPAGLMVVAAATTSKLVAVQMPELAVARMPELVVSMGTIAAFPLPMQPVGSAEANDGEGGDNF